MASLSVAVVFLIAFVWAVHNGQYDDDYTPSMRLLVEEDMFKSETEIKEQDNIQDKKIKE